MSPDDDPSQAAAPTQQDQVIAVIQTLCQERANALPFAGIEAICSGDPLLDEYLLSLDRRLSALEARLPPGSYAEREQARRAQTASDAIER